MNERDVQVNPKSLAELSYDYAVLEDRLRNLEKRFKNIELRSLPFLDAKNKPSPIPLELYATNRPCPSCQAETALVKVDDRIWCTQCGYKNWE